MYLSELVISSHLTLTQAGIPVYRPAYFREATYNQLSSIFASTTHVTIPLLNERVKILHETGRVLDEVSVGGQVFPVVIPLQRD